MAFFCCFLKIQFHEECPPFPNETVSFSLSLSLLFFVSFFPFILLSEKNFCLMELRPFNIGRLVYRVTRWPGRRSVGRSENRHLPWLPSENIGRARVCRRVESRRENSIWLKGGRVVYEGNFKARYRRAHSLEHLTGERTSERTNERASERASQLASSLISPSFRSKYSSGCGTTGRIRWDRSASRL